MNQQDLDIEKLQQKDNCLRIFLNWIIRDLRYLRC